MYWITRFGSTDLPIHKPRQDAGTASARTAYINLPAGNRIDGYGNVFRSPLNGEDITVTATIGNCTPAELNARHRELRRLTGTRQALKRQMDDSDDYQFVMARCRGISATRSFPEDFRKMEIDIGFSLESAKWKDDEGLLWKLDDGNFLDTGLFLDAGTTPFTITSGSDTIAVIVSDSDIEITDSAVTFQVVSGSMTSPKIFNPRNDMFIEWQGTLVPDDELIIDFGRRKVTLNGNPAYSINIGGFQIEWMILERGQNDIVIESTMTGETTLLWRWENNYL